MSELTHLNLSKALQKSTTHSGNSSSRWSLFTQLRTSLPPGDAKISNLTVTASVAYIIIWISLSKHEPNVVKWARRIVDSPSYRTRHLLTRPHTWHSWWDDAGWPGHAPLATPAATWLSAGSSFQRQSAAGSCCSTSTGCFARWPHRTKPTYNPLPSHAVASKSPIIPRDFRPFRLFFGHFLRKWIDPQYSNIRNNLHIVWWKIKDQINRCCVFATAQITPALQYFWYRTADYCSSKKLFAQQTLQ